jgi:hypothetical protein
MLGEQRPPADWRTRVQRPHGPEPQTARMTSAASSATGERKDAMGNTIMGAVVSLDGYIADASGDVGPLFDWYGNGEVEWKFTEQPRRTVSDHEGVG